MKFDHLLLLIEKCRWGNQSGQSCVLSSKDGSHPVGNRRTGPHRGRILRARSRFKTSQQFIHRPCWQVQGLFFSIRFEMSIRMTWQCHFFNPLLHGSFFPTQYLLRHSALYHSYLNRIVRCRIHRDYYSLTDRFRQYGLWDRYSDLYPNHDLIFNVGTSSYQKNWFFAHVTRFRISFLVFRLLFLLCLSIFGTSIF